MTTGMVAATRAERSSAPRWAVLVATFFGAGKLRPGPGTWGSLATLAVWAAATVVIPPQWHLPAALLGVATALALGIPAANRVACAMGDKDPCSVVIDEVAGQMLAFVGTPAQWKSLVAAFILFRTFDILKPPPLRSLERIRGGAGIMLDDIGAGVYALAVVQLLLHFGVLR
ncbi:MAG: phosphatidylglycerophosphatase A [Terriglobales bacterium]